MNSRRRISALQRFVGERTHWNRVLMGVWARRRALRASTDRCREREGAWDDLRSEVAKEPGKKGRVSTRPLGEQNPFSRGVERPRP
jgi:hypothetical protein